jgi:hypothetical protein
MKDKQVQRYMDILLSSVDYSTFVSLMKLMRPIALHRQQALEAEAKQSTGDGYNDSKTGSSKISGGGAKVGYDRVGDDDYDGADSKVSESHLGESKGAEKMSK